MPRSAPPLDYDTLAEFLKALSYPARLELLDKLRFPKTASEIRLAPRRVQPGENPDRPSARPTVLGHLELLVEAGLVKDEEFEEHGHRVHRYVVNPMKLYGLTEELRRLSTMYAGRGGAGDATGTLAGAEDVAPATGPRLVLVHGVYEGKSFALAPGLAHDGGWVIGRKRGLPVCLDYDPYVSFENAVVEQRGGGFRVRDLTDSKNGTAVNWATLPKGGEGALEAGDIIGVGRSLLCFRPT
jgi:DNA-binding transcriptional ArsR family regulator